MSRRVSIVQIGVGTVGSEVARLVLAGRARQLAQGLDLTYAALADTSGAVVSPDGLPPGIVARAVEAKRAGRALAELEGGRTLCPEELVGLLSGLESAVLVDCAVGDATYDAHLLALRRGWRSVLSNKAPLAVSQERYDALACAARGRLWHEATVGAGLPVIGTLRSLLEAGDEVEEIAGCLSGTLGFITTELVAGTPYSEAVRRARDLGYTEPDPRDDLSGLDVARKALILARVSGRRLSLEDVRVQPLLPPLDPALSVREFLAAAEAGDERFGSLVERARRRGRTLRYVARVPAEGEVTVGLVEVEAESRIGSLSGPDNIVQMRTREYREHPLVVIGPGAGPVVTAMGVLSDLLEAARSCAG